MYNEGVDMRMAHQTLSDEGWYNSVEDINVCAEELYEGVDG